MTRSARIEDYIRTARAKGLREHQVLLVYALRPPIHPSAYVQKLEHAQLLQADAIPVSCITNYDRIANQSNK
jgi:ABC-type dipeptide/oligopeptide/nickel transport system permease component